MAKTKTVVKYTRNLTKAEYRECYRKNLGVNGRMREEMRDHFYDKGSNSKVILIKEETGRIIAWSLVQFDMDALGANAYYWVIPSARRRGLGKRLMHHTIKMDPQGKPYVFPHDEKSGSFFADHVDKIRYSRYDEWCVKK